MSDALAQMAVGALGTVAVLLAKAVWERARRKNGGAIEHRMKTVEIDHAALDLRVHKLANRLGPVENRLGIAETNVTNVKESISRIEDTLVRMDGKLDRALAR